MLAKRATPLGGMKENIMSKAVGGYDYTVKEGDSLSKIAGDLWTDAVYASNRVTVGEDPNHIEPGEVIKLPGVDGGTLHVEVEAGDTLTGITQAWMWPHLYGANHATVGVDPNLIHPGQLLEVPELDWTLA